MRLSNKQVRNIIVEELRQVLSENAAFFGESFTEFKDRVDAGEPALQVAEEVLYQLGQGSTRIVYGFPDNPTIVLKVINTTHPIVDKDSGEDMYGFTKQNKLVSNQNEADLQMQQQYPGVFPKSYEVAKDFSWIVTERVDPMDHQELLSHFGLPSYVTPSLYKKINVSIKIAFEIPFFSKKQTRGSVNDFFKFFGCEYLIFGSFTKIVIITPTSINNDVIMKTHFQVIESARINESDPGIRLDTL